MEISEKEYEELKMKIHELTHKVENMSCGRKKTLADKVKVLPHERVNNISTDHPAFEYGSSSAYDTWNIFLMLAKRLHVKSPLYYMGTAYADFYGTRKEPYIRFTGKEEVPKRIADMTHEQQEMSINMLNEMIPIWNKYFEETHKEVLYDPDGLGNYIKIKVIASDDE